MTQNYYVNFVSKALHGHALYVQAAGDALVENVCYEGEDDFGDDEFKALFMYCIKNGMNEPGTYVTFFDDARVAAIFAVRVGRWQGRMTQNKNVYCFDKTVVFALD